MIPYTITQDYVCVVWDDKPVLIKRGASQFTWLRDVLIKESWEELPLIVNALKAKAEEDDELDEPDEDPDMPPDEEEDAEDSYEDDDESDAENPEDGNMHASTLQTNIGDKKPKLIRGFIRLSKVPSDMLINEPIRELRRYAGKGLKIVGASKIRGGKNALVKRILQAR